VVDVVGTQRSHSRRGRRGPWSTWSERSLTDRRSDAVWRFDRRPSGVVGLSRCPNRWMLHGRLTYDLGGSLDGSDGTLSSLFRWRTDATSMPQKIIVAIMSTSESFVVTYAAPILAVVFGSDAETGHDAHVCCTCVSWLCRCICMNTCNRFLDR